MTEPQQHLSTQPRQDEVLERRAMAVRLRKAGLGYRQIAQQIGYASPSSAHKAVMEGLKDTIADAVDEMRDIENARYDAWQAALEPACIRGEPRAIEAALKVSARRARLNGLDAPQQVAVTGSMRADLSNALVTLRETILGEVTDVHDEPIP